MTKNPNGKIYQFLGHRIFRTDLVEIQPFWEFVLLEDENMS